MLVTSSECMVDGAWVEASMRVTSSECMVDVARVEAWPSVRSNTRPFLSGVAFSDRFHLEFGPNAEGRHRLHASGIWGASNHELCHYAGDVMQHTEGRVHCQNELVAMFDCGRQQLMHT
jgi:predicted SprT family Zn-dependent metalloprotease